VEDNVNHGTWIDVNGNERDDINDRQGVRPIKMVN